MWYMHFVIHVRFTNDLDGLSKKRFICSVRSENSNVGKDLISKSWCFLACSWHRCFAQVYSSAITTETVESGLLCRAFTGKPVFLVLHLPLSWSCMNAKQVHCCRSVRCSRVAKQVYNICMEAHPKRIDLYDQSYFCILVDVFFDFCTYLEDLQLFLTCFFFGAASMHMCKYV